MFKRFKPFKGSNCADSLLTDRWLLITPRLQPPSLTARLAHAVEVPTVRRNIERAQVSIAEGTHQRLVRGHGLGFQYAAGGCNDIDHRAWPAFVPAGASNDVTLAVQAHARNAAVHPAVVRAKRVQDRVRAQVAVAVNRISP